MVLVKTLLPQICWRYYRLHVNFPSLEEGDVAEVTRFEVNIFDTDGKPVEREAKESEVATTLAIKVNIVTTC